MKSQIDPDLEYYLSKPRPAYELPRQAMIGDMLDDHNISYFYKTPVLVYDQGQRAITRPDFTLPAYNNTVIDYISDNSKDAEQLKQLYDNNNIPSILLNDSDLKKPHWQQNLFNRIEYIYHNYIADLNEFIRDSNNRISADIEPAEYLYRR